MKTSTRFFVVFCLLLVACTAALIVTSPAQAQAVDPPADGDFWSTLAQSVALQFAPILAAALAAWVLKEFGKLWLSFKESQPDVAIQIEHAAQLAVRAAEQAGAAGYITNKKQYALQVATNWLLTKNIKVDLELISAAIEASVLDEFNRFKDKETDPGDSEEDRG